MKKITPLIWCFALFLISSIGFSQGTLQVTGNTNVITSGDVTPSNLDDTDFGNVTLGFNNPNTFTLDNTATGGSPGNRLNGITVTITGANAADFTPNVAALGNLTGTGTPINHVITFTPGAIGLRTATVTITFTNGTNSPYTYAIQGTGIAPAPEMDVTGLGISIPDNDTTPVTTDDTDYGPVNVLTPSVHTFTIQNTGSLVLNLTGLAPHIVVTGANAAEFVVSAAPAPVIAAAGMTTFNITFTPAATGLRTATLTIANDDGDENPYNFDIQGTGYVPSPEIDITGLGISIVDGDTTPDIADDTDFVSSLIGTPVVHTFTINNSGPVILNLGAITITGTNPGDFTITTAPAATVAASGGSTTFDITFNPTAGGTRTASFSIVTDDLNENPYNFDLHGYGTSPPPVYTAFYENFDASDGGWTVTTATNGNWIWTNVFTTTDEMGEGSFWRNSNYNTYNTNTTIVIESPQYDFTGLQNLWLHIDIKYNTENNNDGMRILYSVSGGAYTVLGASGDGTNWYQDNVSALGSDGWNNDGHSASPAFSPHSQFGRAFIDLSDGVFSNQSNVKFRIEFASDNSGTAEGVAFDNFLIEADPITSLNDATVGPANLTSNLRLWLKANSGIAVADGAALTNWEDQAYDTTLDKEDAYAETSLAPTYRDNATRNMNFNPVADFDNTATEYMQGKGGFFSQDYFIVVRSDDVVDTQTGPFSPGRQFAFGGRFSDDSYHEDPTGLGFGSTSARYADEIISHSISSFPNGSSPPNNESYGRSYSSATDNFENQNLIINVKTNVAGTVTEIYKNGKQLDNTTGQAGNGADLNFNEFDNLQYLVGTGRSGIAGRTTSQLNGMLSEVISYSDINSALNQQKIQSYLGIKYGVTIQDAASALTDYRLNDVDYIDSQGTVVWDTSANSGFNYDIAGIGRDDNSLLEQKQSRSQNDESDVTGPTSGLITMGLTQIYDTNNDNITSNATTLNDREFLIWGNNNASLDGAANTVTVDMSVDIGDASLITNVTFDAIPRIWKVVEIGGDIPSVEVSIPTSAVRTATPPDGRYLMFISATGVFDPTADYRIMTESGGSLSTDYDFDGTEYITFGWAPETTFVRSVYFDPTHSDYIDIEDNLDLNPAEFTISAWIKRGSNSLNKSILSKRNSPFTEGFDLKITATGYLQMQWINGGTQSIQSSVVIPTDEWHHVAVIYDGTTATLYIDGVADTSGSLSVPVSTTQSFFIGAANKTAPTAFFEGNIDEVRVWDTALTPGQLQYIMNQEIEDNASFVGGKYFQDLGITPTKDDVSTVPWSNLEGYYPMSTYTYTNTKDASGNGRQGALKNLKTVDWQTAPLPYESTQNGDWDIMNTWLNGDVQTIPGTTSIVDNTKSINWNIVRTAHDVTLNDDADLPAGNNGNRSVLGLFVDANTLTVDGDTASGTGYGLTVTHYLDLDGDIDLEGESQLIQTIDSDLEVASSGKLERDQQGTADLYTYNYWSAPVGISNIISNNNNFTVPDILFDGALNINFLTTGYDGSSGTPISLADFWFWKFANQLDDDYSSWQHIRSTGTVNAGEGFTMKGPGTGGISDDQNYVFLGKPNNGDINLTLSAGNDYLVGNPYASAIDAEQFILDNGSLISGTGATTGTLYYWEHWGGGSHALASYQGGYATYTLSGGVPSAAQGTNDPDVGTGGTPVKTPGRYIPIGQGFFVVAEGAGGTINFNNGQRLFRKESASSVFMQANPTGNLTYVTGTINTTSNVEPADPRTQLRIGFNSVNTLRRQLLLTIDDNASDSIDWGYEGELYENQLDDMYWMIEDKKYMIQATNVLEIESTFQLGVHTGSDGLNSFALDGFFNDPNALDVYLHDKDLNIFHNLSEGIYEVFLMAGEHLNRFEIVFDYDADAEEEGEDEDVEEEIIENTEDVSENIDVFYSNDLDSIIIINPSKKEIRSLDMFNVLGQTVYSAITMISDDHAEYKVSNLSTGTYILKIETEIGIITKKVLIR